MYRYYDVRCCACRSVYPSLIWTDSGKVPGKVVDLDCPECGIESGKHDRLVSLPAEYHGERSLNVEVHGGAFDTAGSRAPVTMDPLPCPPAEASRSDRREHIDAYRERFASREWKETKRENASIARENAAKRQRLAAIKRGENFNMRRDKLPGDPKVTA